MNLTQNPNVVIRKDITRFRDLYHELDKAVTFLKDHKKMIDNTLNQIARIDISIKEHQKKLEKKKEEKTAKSLASLLKHRQVLMDKSKNIQKDFIKYSTQSYLNFTEIIKILYRLNIQCLTLLHRARKDIENLILRAKALRHIDIAALEQLKSEAISLLNKSKKHLKNIADKLYRSSEYQDRYAFNPREVLRELSLQSTIVKARRIRQLTIEIDHIENKIDSIMKSMAPTDIHWFVEQNLNHQILDFDKLSHHIKILNHRVHKLIYKYPENKKLKKEFRKTLRKLVKQTRLLWNSIKIEHYKPKIPKEKKEHRPPKRFWLFIPTYMKKKKEYEKAY